MQNVAVLPRIRFRIKRRRPPSERRLLYTIYMGAMLVQLGHSVILLLSAWDTFVFIVQLIVIPFWAWMYCIWRRMRRVHDWLEEQGIHRQTHPSEWMLCCLYVGLVAWICLTPN